MGVEQLQSVGVRPRSLNKLLVRCLARNASEWVNSESLATGGLLHYRSVPGRDDARRLIRARATP